jgi:hypothetical protein
LDTLFIPIRVRQLFLAQTTQVASAAADFSRLPYYDQTNKCIVNNNNPFIIENVVNEPFQDDLQPLEPGAHLHFILPSQFTHASSDGQNLTAPNRWPVQKGAGTAYSVIESDYLSEQPIKRQCNITTSVIKHNKIML